MHLSTQLKMCDAFLAYNIFVLLRVNQAPIGSTFHHGFSYFQHFIYKKIICKVDIIKLFFKKNEYLVKIDTKYEKRVLFLEQLVETNYMTDKVFIRDVSNVTVQKCYNHEKSSSEKRLEKLKLF